MKIMLRRLGCFSRHSLFRSHPSIALRPIHHAPSPCSSHRREPSDSPAAAAAKEDPAAAGWVMLNSYGAIRSDDSSSAADANTVADSRTSTGRHLRIWFARAAPPASSFLYFHWADSVPDDDDDDDEDEDEEEDEDDDEEEVDYMYMHFGVVAAHGDSVLLKMSDPRSMSDLKNHFVYRAGAAGRPPSLSLLPARDFLTKTEHDLTTHRLDPIRPMMHSGNTGLLRRDDNELLVVTIQLKYDRAARRDMAEFCVLRHGTRRWELMEPVPIADDEEARRDLLLGRGRRSGPGAVIPVGDRFLCWVEYSRGFLLCDMAASPKVRYVPFPSGVSWEDDDPHDDAYVKHSKNMGAAGGGGARAVRFVSVDPHCCCGGAGRSTCLRSRYAFTINTWKMNLAMEEPLAWEKDGEIDCEELWALPGYESLPRANVQCPVVSLDKPDVVCFLVSNYQISRHEDGTIWMIELNVRTKTLLSVVQFANDPWRAYHHLPATVRC